jgi:predicted amidohydrolase
MENFKVALLQISPTGTVQGNFEKGIEYCRKAKKLGADLALFPELYSDGYNCKSTPIDQPHEFVTGFAELAKELEMAIAITFYEKTKARPRNTVIVFDRHGKSVLKYSKVHTCDWTMENAMDAGDSFDVGTLDYDGGKVNIGAMICYDRDFPESARILMLNGAEIILVPNCCRVYGRRLLQDQLKVRAYENSVGIAMTNYPTNDINDGNGGSCAYHPIYFDYQKSISHKEYIDTTILEMGTDEQIQIAEFNIQQIKEFRAITHKGGAYRKPWAYKTLLSETKEPFIRPNARKR